MTIKPDIDIEIIMEEPDLKFHVEDNDYTADKIFDQIKRFYPDLKENKKGAISIEVVLGKDVDHSIIEELGRMITESQILEFRDSFIFRSE